MIEFEKRRGRHADGPEEGFRRPGHYGEGERHREGRRRGEGGRRGGRRGKKELSSLLDGRSDAMLLFVGAVGCARHRAGQLGGLMRAGRLAMLCPTATDYATGRYLHQTVDAMVELSQERGVKEFVVMYGCQWAVLSTGFELLAQELKDSHGITATLDAACHLCGNAQGDEDDHRDRERM